MKTIDISGEMKIVGENPTLQLSLSKNELFLIKAAAKVSGIYQSKFCIDTLVSTAETVIEEAKKRGYAIVLNGDKNE